MEEEVKQPEIKHPLLSKGIWGALIVAIFALLEAFGVSLPFTPEEAQTTVYKVLELAGAALAFWGRWSANSKIGSVLKTG